jgi:hypothetical protein
VTESDSESASSEEEGLIQACLDPCIFFLFQFCLKEVVASVEVFFTCVLSQKTYNALHQLIKQ